jgi:sulfur carrier protein
MKTNCSMCLTVNGQPLEVETGCTIAQLLEKLQIRSRAIAVELNQEIQPSAAFSVRLLQNNDCLEIVTLVGGG